MRLIWLVVGIIALLIGIVWTLQGLNILRGGGMSGHSIFTVIGLVVGVIGLVLIVVGVQRLRAPAA
jgi:hypothetical protein